MPAQYTGPERFVYYTPNLKRHMNITDAGYTGCVPNSWNIFVWETMYSCRGLPYRHYSKWPMRIVCFFHPYHLRFYGVGGIGSHSCNALACAMFLKLQHVVCKFDYSNQQFEYLNILSLLYSLDCIKWQSDVNHSYIYRN